MSFSYRPHNARLSWQDGMPFADDYGDVYYSRADALGESSHVFLAGNNLQQRFAELRHGHFCIGELGFGAGLNFLNTCQLWCSHAPASATLHYVACELHPLRRADLARLLAQFPQLTVPAAALLAQYPDHSRGTHQLAVQLGAHRIVLTLLHDDATEAFGALATHGNWQVDAWFLDGFAPRTNPGMWSLGLLQQVALLSHADTTLASYSVAGEFRRALQAAGFDSTKAAGHAGKRHMLRARRRADAAARIPSPLPPPPQAEPGICVVGGGLAGCSTARALADAGWQVVLLERGPQLAMGASGNPQGILHFKPATVDSADNRFNYHAWLHAMRHYQALNLPESHWSPCGVLQVAHDDKLLKRFAALQQADLYDASILQVLDADAASAVAGVQLQRPALHFPAAGWLGPQRLCHWYTAHPGINVTTGQAVTDIRPAAGGWQVLTQGSTGAGSLAARHVVLCNSADAGHFLQAAELPLICNRGQVDLHAAADAVTLGAVVCGQGYLIPAGPEGQALGGSFFLGPDAAVVRDANRQQHLAQLGAIQPGLQAHFAARRPVLQRVAERCTLPGRLPAAGLLAGSPAQGLWLNIGHGSHGLARTPVCAALLASMINYTPAPLAPELIQILDPRRFG